MWDIGCDHGKLGLSFVNHAGVSEVHLVDPSEPVIETLKKTVAAYTPVENSLKIHVHHSPGQNIKLSPSPQSLFIAGMGGMEILEILKSLKPQLREARVILSPHRNMLELREFLRSENFTMEDEALVFEDGRFYPVLVTGLNPKYPRASLYGEMIWNHELASDYQQKELKHYSAYKVPRCEAYCEYLKSRGQ